MSNQEYSAQVIALLRGSDTLITSNEEIGDNPDFFRVVLGCGSNDLIEIGTRFIIYTFGEELFDPVTRESLGYFEVVRGEGKVDQVQPKMCVVRSERKTTERRARGLLGGINALNPDGDYHVVTVAAPFKGPRVGDLARLI